MKKILTGLVLTLCATFASAATIEFAANLNGAQEVPANAVPGIGTAGLVLDDVTGALGWVISFEGLSSQLGGAHIHKGPVGQDGGIEIHLPDFDVFNGSQALGRIEGLFVGGVTITAQQISDLKAGLWYINLHTAEFPGGEIRGQVLSGTFNPVPLPAAVWLMAPAIGALVMRRRKAKQTA